MVQYFIRKDAVNYDINSFELAKELEKAINTCDVSITKTDGANISIGDEVSIGYVDGGFQTLFSGIVTNKEENEDVKIIIESFGGQIYRINAAEIYEDKSPEFIAEDLITNYTDLTYASTSTSGIVIKRFVVNDEPISDAFKYLLELLSDWTISSDNDKNFYFQPRNFTTNSNVLTVNSNCYLASQWSRNPDKIINQLSLVGDVQTFSTDSDSFVATGGETTTTLSYKPKGNVKIFKNGTELTGGVEDATTSPDYTYNRDTKVVTFTVALTVSDDIDIFYEYEVPVKVTAQNDVSIDRYGVRSTKIVNKTIRTMTDARTFVQNYLAQNSTEDVSGEITVSQSFNADVGQLIAVVDTFNNIDNTLLITGVKVGYPDGLKTLRLGKFKFDTLQREKEIEDRLRKLEQNFDNSELLQLYREIPENIEVKNYQTKITYTRDIDKSWIVGSSTNAIVGTWTGTAGGGQLVVGPTNNTITTLSITNNANTFIDTYDSDTYYDSGSSTATISTINKEITFTAGQVATSKAIFSNDQTTTFVTPNVTIDSGDVDIELSNDNGTNWTATPNNTRTALPEPSISVGGGNLLLETGDALLQENGDFIQLDAPDTLTKDLLYRLTENSASTATVSQAIFKYEV